MCCGRLFRLLDALVINVQNMTLRRLRLFSSAQKSSTTSPIQQNCCLLGEVSSSICLFRGGITKRRSQKTCYEVASWLQDHLVTSSCTDSSWRNYVPRASVSGWRTDVSSCSRRGLVSPPFIRTAVLSPLLFQEGDFPQRFCCFIFLSRGLIWD